MSGVVASPVESKHSITLSSNSRLRLLEVSVLCTAILLPVWCNVLSHTHIFSLMDSHPAHHPVASDGPYS